MTEGKDFSTLSTSKKVGDDEDSETYADQILGWRASKSKTRGNGFERVTQCIALEIV